MNDTEIVRQIDELVEREHNLQRGHSNDELSEEERKQLNSIETQLDHRMAMAFLVLGLAANEPVRINDVAPIATSFPGFIELMNRLGAAIGEAE